MSEEYPLVNGRAPGWANTKITLSPNGGADFETRDFTGVKFADGHDGELLFGTGSLAVAKLDGQVAPEGSFTMLLPAFVRFQAALAAINPEIGAVDFDVHVSWSPKTGPAAGRTFDAVMYGCSIKKRSFDGAGGKAAEVEVELLYTLLEIDGVALYRS